MIYFHFRAKDCIATPHSQRENATLRPSGQRKFSRSEKLRSFCDITKVMPIFFFEDFVMSQKLRIFAGRACKEAGIL